MQNTSLSADNRCQSGPAFHFTIPVAVRASGRSGADLPVVSRQSLPVRARIPFHDTCSYSCLLALSRRSPRCQPTIELVRAGFPFHDTCSYSCLLALSHRSPRCQPTIELVRAGFPFHDTCSYSCLLVLRRRTASCQPTIDACQGRNSFLCTCFCIAQQPPEVLTHETRRSREFTSLISRPKGRGFTRIWIILLDLYFAT